MDYAATPPEITSSLMYAGPGVGPMLGATAAWDGLASGLSASAAQYASVIGSLDGVWSGASAMAMRTSAIRFLQWLTQTATMAQQTAMSTQLAAEAFTTAFTMTVPPEVIALNRSELAILVATNILGQNSAAIAANQAEYAEFWATDVAAMYGYQASAQAATAALPTFTDPPQVANPLNAPVTTATTGGTQGILSSLTGIDPNSGWLGLFNLYMEAFVSSAPVTNVTSIIALMALADLRHDVDGHGISEDPPQEVPVPVTPTTAAPATAATSAARAPVNASVGAAQRAGALSVPKAWGSLPPERISVLTAPSSATMPRAQSGIPVPPAVPVMGGRSDQNRKRKPDPEYGHVHARVMSRHPSGG